MNFRIRFAVLQRVNEWNSRLPSFKQNVLKNTKLDLIHGISLLFIFFLRNNCNSLDLLVTYPKFCFNLKIQHGDGRRIKWNETENVWIKWNKVGHGLCLLGHFISRVRVQCALLSTTNDTDARLYRSHVFCALFLPQWWRDTVVLTHTRDLFLIFHGLASNANSDHTKSKKCCRPPSVSTLRLRNRVSFH